MILTLSRQLGSGGDSIAARVTTALGLTLVDREFIHKAALAAGVPENLLQMLMYERRRSLAGEVMDSLGGQPGRVSNARVPAASPLLGTFAPMMPPAAISPEEADQSVGLIVKEIASHGGVLILGQGAQVWLRGYAGACHVQIVAPLDLRIAHVAQREGISVAAARRRVRDCDQARSNYLARYHNARWLDPLLYHLVINTGQMPIEAAVSLILHAAQAVGSGA